MNILYSIKSNSTIIENDAFFNGTPIIKINKSNKLFFETITHKYIWM